MKKLLALLLAVVMCASFVACGGEETNNTGSQKQEEKTIEITMDNWQDYFEIKQCLGSYITTNEFDEFAEASYDLTTFFTVKEEFVEDVVSCDIAIGYDADVSAKSVVFNASDLTFDITGDYTGDVPPIYSDSSMFTRGATAKLGYSYFYQHYLKDGKVEKNQIPMPYSVIISGFDHDGISAKILIDDTEEWNEVNEGYINKYTDNIKITRIEGTLVLNQ